MDYTSLLQIFKNIGTLPKIVLLFQQLYDGAESCVWVDGMDSGWFPINSRVRQGCVAVPDLYNCVIDYLMIKVCEKALGVSFGLYHLADLEYTDDTTLLTSSVEQLSQVLAIYNMYHQECQNLASKSAGQKWKQCTWWWPRSPSPLCRHWWGIVCLLLYIPQLHHYPHWRPTT